MTPLLDVAGLTIRTDDGRTVVDDLSFTLEAGGRLGLIGESGSGKSLTTLAVLGLLPDEMQATGSITLAGTQIVGARERDLVPVRGRDAAVVFQEPRTALDPLMRVGGQIAEPLRRRLGLTRREVETAVLDALDQVRLPEPRRIARAFPHEISGGQRQRVALAIALACDPRLLIADEPTTALDVSVQAEMLDLIDGIVRERDMSVLFVSHDLAVVARITDEAVVMRAGRAVESGSIATLVRSPRDPYTRSLLDSARRLENALEERMSQ